MAVEGVSKQAIAISALVLPLCTAQNLLTFCLMPPLIGPTNIADIGIGTIQPRFYL